MGDSKKSFLQANINLEKSKMICDVNDTLEMKSIDIRGNTHLFVKCITYTWSIDNFSIYSHFSKKKIFSPEFNIINTPFQIRLRLIEEEGDEYFLINLFKVKRDGINHHAKYKMKLLCNDSSCKCVLHSQEEELLFGDKRRFGRQLKIPKNEQLQCILNDTLYVQCEIMVLSENSFITKVNKSKAEKKALKRKASRHEKLLFNLFPILIFIVCYSIIIFENPAVHERLTRSRCAVYQDEVQKLIINSTLKLNDIGEALNLTEIKEITSKFILSYAEMFNITHSEVSRISSNSLQNT